MFFILSTRNTLFASIYNVMLWYVFLNVSQFLSHKLVNGLFDKTVGISIDQFLVTDLIKEIITF